MNKPVVLPGLPGIFLLGLLQILVWGGSFFLLAVMAAPIVADTGWASQWVYGALSLSLLVSALLAPGISRLIARFGGRPVLACSGAAVAVGLLLMAAAPSLTWFLLAWVVIGGAWRWACTKRCSRRWARSTAKKQPGRSPASP